MKQQKVKQSPLTLIYRLSVLLALFLPVNAEAASGEIEGIRIRSAPERTRIVFDVTRPVEHQIFTLKSPRRLVIDIVDVELKADFDSLSLKKTPIINIRQARRGNKDLRVVFDLNAEVNPRSFVLKPIVQYGDRLVIDLYRVEQQVTPSVQQADQLAKQMRDVVIAVDAGHGGEDPGAIGHGKLREKDVVLKIAKQVQNLFDRETGFKVVMVRNGDYYVSKKQRRKIAHKHQADVFVSVHADAFKTAGASGASVYTISQQGATSEMAEYLAEKANRDDLIGGVGAVSLDDKDDLLVGVLLDLSMTHSLATSMEIGSSVIKALKGVTKLHAPKVEQAAFTVLKSPDIPSILVETGYISNPGDARALKSVAHQKKLARAIVTGVKRYVVMSPPVGSYLAWKKQESAHNLLPYIIESGDTLTDIADRHRVSAERIKKVNGLRSDIIRIGQVLKIPSS